MVKLAQFKLHLKTIVTVLSTEYFASIVFNIYNQHKYNLLLATEQFLQEAFNTEMQ